MSIPDTLRWMVDRLVRRSNLRRSRSELFSAALSEYVPRHAPDEATAAMNRVCDNIRQEADRFATTASRRVLERSEW